MRIGFFGTYDKTYTSNQFFLQGLEANNISVVEINAHTKVTALLTAKDMSWMQLIKRFSKKFRIITETIRKRKELKTVDVIYVGYPGHVDVFFAFIVAKLFGKKLVFNPLLTIYIGFTEERVVMGKNSVIGQMIKFFEKTAYNLCNMVFADTPYQKNLFQKIFTIPSSKIRVLPIGADNKGYEYSIYKNNDKKINVVYYGLYSSIHGVEYIIEAANILKNDKNIIFTLVGNGSEYDTNFKRVQELKLKNVKFYPDIMEGQHLELLQKADVFLGLLQKHPSVDRIIPNKVYQGLALGRAVLTADAPVTRSVFTHKKDIYLVKKADAKSLAAGLLELKNNPKLRSDIAKNGYQRYINEFSPKEVVGKLIKYVEEIL
jgi:glycosyltransferase involved in cell wall biosynthesis